MSQQLLNIYLDLDGVLANFSKKFCQEANLKYPENTYLEFDWFKKQSDKSIWEFGIDMNHDFWMNIEAYPWAKDMIKVVENYDKDFRFLSACTRDSGAFSGKYEWVKRIFGQKYTKKLILCTNDKSFASAPYRVLIDDKIQNCEDWEEFGGIAYRWRERTDDMFHESISELIELDSFLADIAHEIDQNRIRMEHGIYG